AVEAAGMFSELDPYDHRAIRVRSSNDRVAARLLQKAIIESKKKQFPKALELITQAKELAPTYPEVYKVSAFIKAHCDDFFGARSDYEQALDLSPDSPQILFLYAGFLAYRLNDSAAALEAIERAAQLDPQNVNVRAERARYLTFLGRYEEAWPLFAD